MWRLQAIAWIFGTICHWSEIGDYSYWRRWSNVYSAIYGYGSAHKIYFLERFEIFIRAFDEYLPVFVPTAIINMIVLRKMSQDSTTTYAFHYAESIIDLWYLLHASLQWPLQRIIYRIP